MRVRWTTDAADDLERICDYVARERPEAARRLALDVLHAIEGLRVSEPWTPWTRPRHSRTRADATVPRSVRGPRRGSAGATNPARSATVAAVVAGATRPIQRRPVPVK